MKIQELEQKVKDFMQFRKGFVACDITGYCLKCVDLEAACASRLKYIFFVDNGDVTLYQS